MKDKTHIKVRDLKPSKDAKGGLLRAQSVAAQSHAGQTHAGQTHAGQLRRRQHGGLRRNR